MSTTQNQYLALAKLEAECNFMLIRFRVIKKSKDLEV
jgi:hypothetical protein